MKLILLGSGSSEGVPVLGCGCHVCSSNKLRNKRSRQSLYIETKNTKILIDPGQDFKFQMMRNKLSYLDGVLITHAHFDHIGGLNDLRSVCGIRKTPVPLYSDIKTLNEIKKSFGYLFGNIVYMDECNKIPATKRHSIKEYTNYKIGDIDFLAFQQCHGRNHSLGFKFKNFVYSTDVNCLSDKAIDIIRGTDLWFVDCLCYKESKGHAGLENALAWIREVKPRKAILIHMSHFIDYYDLRDKLPCNVALGHDDMIIKL